MIEDLGLGPVDQIAFAVEDLDAVLPYYTALFGPMTTRRIALGSETSTFRGEPAPIELYVAFGQSGGMQIEVIEVEKGNAAAGEHLRLHGEGIHHLRFQVEDIAAKTLQLQEAGFEVISEGSIPGVIASCYVQAPARYGHSVFELVQRFGTS